RVAWQRCPGWSVLRLRLHVRGSRLRRGRSLSCTASKLWRKRSSSVSRACKSGCVLFRVCQWLF
ncbi:hypothetical protein GGF45_004838, partial [Coemansia sp. RSA 551]